MKRQIPKNPIKRRREHRRIAKLRKVGRIVKGVEIPEDALAADPDKQEYGKGYAVKFYYQDIRYTCAGCGKEGLWTAAQQKRYFEEQTGNIYNQPKWCYECHGRRMEIRNTTRHSDA